jgi:hypothetical protein
MSEAIGIKDEIFRRLEREPFEPFQIVLASGDRYEVTNPHLLAVGESVVHVMLPRSDAYHVLRLSQVTAINALEPAA